MTIEQYKELFIGYLNEQIKTKEPKNLYEPITYILNLGGKRLRPILTLMSCDAFGGKVENALNAAVAVEVFHNFSLVHDDIMDSAPVRRGKPTVHTKWDENTGILSGDAMMILAYQFFETYDSSSFKSLAKLFSKTAIEVCEGQQYDIDFETKEDVAIAAYLKMIEFKTAVLVAAALKMGAIIANATLEDQKLIYDYGLNLGIAFQLQDDYLDVYGEADFGKQKAGDVIENKKTWLYLKTLELASLSDKNTLLDLYKTVTNNEPKIAKVTSLFNKYDVPLKIKGEIRAYTAKAFDAIDKLSIEQVFKVSFKDLGVSLMNRSI